MKKFALKQSLESTDFLDLPNHQLPCRTSQSVLSQYHKPTAASCDSEETRCVRRLAQARSVVEGGVGQAPASRPHLRSSTGACAGLVGCED